ncbi:hypothetical protein [Modestobacter lapidis]|nr:hypothetical protein [Modestobacter lapidis]
MPTTHQAARPAGRRRAPRTSAAVGALLLAGVALAGPAAAIEDPRRPVAEVTHGPSCGPGVVRVQVANGNQPHRVALVFDGTVVQDVADLEPGDRVELGSADVGWGSTVHVAVTVTDAAGEAQLPLDFGTYTRPSKADCDALVPRPGPVGPLPDAVAPASPGSPPAGGAKAPAPLPPMGAGGPSPVPGQLVPGPHAVPVGDPAPASLPEQVVAAPVAPGGVVTVRGSGFTPGEAVDVSLDGVAEPLATVVAAPDGTVEAIVQVPRGAELGSVTVHLVGRSSSATSGLDLQVAARQQTLAASSAPVPAFAAGAALLVASVGLGMAAARRPRTVSAHSAAPTRRR